MSKSPRLITIPVSHYCEKTRWALKRLQIPFIEERHMPPFHRFATRSLQDSSVTSPSLAPGLSFLNRLVLQTVGGQSVPVLVTPTAIFRSSDEILHYVDSIAPEHLKLYPSDAQQRQAIDELVDLFDTVLAPAVRLWTYSYIMSQPGLVKPLWCEGVPWIEQLLFPIVFPWMRTNVTQLYGIDDTSIDRSYQTISEVFDRVNGLLSDGRTYLVGDRFSAADLAFVTLAAALVSPPNYGVKLPEFSQLPTQMTKDMQAFQASLAGKFVLRLYQEFDRSNH
jgi:glutathione S-transferase